MLQAWKAEKQRILHRPGEPVLKKNMWGKDFLRNTSEAYFSVLCTSATYEQNACFTEQWRAVRKIDILSFTAVYILRYDFSQSFHVISLE